jgi:transcriptional regulator with XRE-family HTH domain
VTKSSRGPFCRPGKEQGKTALGDRLKQERLRRGFKLNEFADLVGVAPCRITAIENRGTKPSLDTAIAMAQVLDCTLDWLAGLED